MRKNARLDTRLWHMAAGDKPLATSPDHFRVLAYLWTWPETPLCGVMPLSSAAIGQRLNLSPKRVEEVLGELQACGFVHLGDRLVWVDGYIEAQLGAMPTRNVKWVTATVNALAALPDCDLVRRFREHYKLTGAAAPEALPPRKPRRK